MKNLNKVQAYIPENYQKLGKIIIHTETEETPLQKSFKKFQRNIDLMIQQWLRDYEIIQTKKNILNGKAGDVEFF